MNDFKITLKMEQQLADLIDEYGGKKCRDAFSPETKRGRSTVIRRLIIDSLSSHGFHLKEDHNDQAD